MSFQSPKLVFFLPESAKYTIQWEVLDIGIDREYLAKTETEAEYTACLFRQQISSVPRTSDLRKTPQKHLEADDPNNRLAA